MVVLGCWRLVAQWTQHRHWRRRTPVRAFLLLACGALASDIRAAEPPREFTVADSIGMTKLSDPDASDLSHFAPRLKVSADGTKFVAVTYRGNLESGKNEYSLLLFDVDAVRRWLGKRDQEPAPEPRLLATSATSRYRFGGDHAIDQVRWLDAGATVAYIARDQDDVRQAFAVDVSNGQINQLTHHPFDVAMFDASTNRSVVAYAVWTPPDWKERNERGYVVGSQWMQDLGRRDPSDATAEVRYFVQREGNSPVAISVPTGILARTVSVSPDGKLAVLFAQSQDKADQWLQYRAYSAARQASAYQELDRDAFGGVSPRLGHFVLVDTATAMVKPLILAPASLGAVVRALWSSDSSGVVICCSYLPLAGTEGSELARRKEVQAIVEVDVGSGSVRRIMDVPDHVDGKRLLVKHVARLDDDRLEVALGLGESSETRAFERTRTRWRLAPRRGASRSPMLSVHQDLNTPPDLVAAVSEGSPGRRITDLNPAFRRLSMGTAREYQWKDRLGRTFKGGIILPTSYVAGQRYPLVVQASSYPFRSDVFLVDGFGWMTSAFAARALAARGFVVLQMPVAAPIGISLDPKVSGGPWSESGEAPRFTQMLEGAIEALVAEGVVDATRVGLVGFSRTSMHVDHALAFSSHPIAAATIADGLAATPFSQSMVYGLPYPGMLEWEQPSFMGAPFWADGIRLWQERSPFFHLDRIVTPLRIEAYGIGIPAHWDMFALLKRHRRPVEMIHIPSGHHVLVTPRARYTSQQGNVDWFSFWLQGREDPDPAKAAQYERWRYLRAQKEASIKH